MSTAEEFLKPSEAAKRLGVSIKALRLYEQHGLLKPARTAAGWRTYGPAALARASEIASLRALGLSLAEVGRVLRGDPEPALAAHQAGLEDRIRRLNDAAEKVRARRAALRPSGDIKVAFDLPWPWEGERFELRDIRRLNYIIGPLGSGKTRLALAIAEHLPGAVFIGLERESMTKDALIAALESEGPRYRVVDMIEQGLNHSAQQALISCLRHRPPEAPSLFLLTRSSAILDLAAVGPDETIILCPANHSPPTQVMPHPGAPGYEAVATCLASPDVRARTAGVVAVRRELTLGSAGGA